jgi:DNA-binding response OmpR family regulator
MEQSATHGASSRPILVVEDDEDTVATLRMLLEDEGYPSCSAQDAADAIDSMERLDPGLVLLDWSLASSSGQDVLSAARSRDEPRTPIVLMTGNCGVTHAASPDAAAVLRKPFDMAELLRVVERFYQP